MSLANPEYDALYAAVCAAPDDDTPRLVLADWLDEHDDPHRATFIRAQVGLARACDADPSAAALFRFRSTHVYWHTHTKSAQISSMDANVAELSRRCTAGAKKAQARWKAVLGNRKSGTLSQSERGFPYWIQLNNAKHYAEKQPPERLPGFSLAVDAADTPGLDALLACANFTAATGLALNRVGSPDPVRKVGSHPAARNFRLLHVSLTAADPAIPAAVATQTNWSGLTDLSMYFDFRHNQLSLDLPDAFIGATHLRTLTSLRLGCNGLTGTGVARLAALGLPRLRQLEINGTNVDEAGARALASGAFPELRAVGLWGNRIGNAGAAALADCRDRLPHLTTLSVSRGNITDPESASALIAGPGLPALAGLKLSGNRVRELDPVRLAAPGRGPGLRLLSLEGCELSGRAMSALASAPSLAGLEGLKLDDNQIGDEGVAALAHATNWNRLTCLELGRNGITGAGVKALVAWPGVKQLGLLDLRYNPIGLDGAKALAACAALKKCRRIGVPAGPAQMPEEGLHLLRDTFGDRIVALY